MSDGESAKSASRCPVKSGVLMLKCGGGGDRGPHGWRLFGANIVLRLMNSLTELARIKERRLQTNYAVSLTR